MAIFYSGWHSVPNGGAKYRLALTATIASQNVKANTSTVSWALRIQKDRSWRGFYEYAATTKVNVNGAAVYDWPSYPTAEWPEWTQYTLASGSRTIAHNSDGKKTISLSGSWERSALGWSPGTMSVSGSMTLTTIARATTPTVAPSPAAVGATVKVKLPRAATAFLHDVTWESGDLSGTIGTGIGTEVNWVVPDVLDEFPDRDIVPITIVAVTKSGATVIGEKQVTLQVKRPPAPPEIKTFGPSQEFDIRAREVRWDAVDNEWKRGRILPTIKLSMVDPLSATATCSLTMSKLQAVDFDDYSIVDIDIFDGESWRFTNHRFVLSRVEGDDTDPTETFTYSGTEFIDYSLGFAYVPVDYKWTGAKGEFGLTSPGNLIHYCITKAKERGWGPRITVGSVGSRTSFGDTWANKSLNRTVSKGTPISQVLEGMVTDGFIEYRAEYKGNTAELILLNPGTGRSFAETGAAPVVNLALANLTRAPRRGTAEKRLTRVTVVGDTTSTKGNSTTISATRETAPFDADVFGHMEGWVSASGVGTTTEARRVGDNALRDNSTVVSERTFEYNAQDADPQFFPYAVFRPGDWVLIPGDTEPISDRINQITIDKDEDGKTFTILTGDRIMSGVASLAKRQAAQTGGAISGGNGTTPAPLDERIPEAPVLSNITSTGYWTTDGTAKSEITLSWTPVERAMSGSEIAIDLYEIWWRDLVGGAWKFRAATDETEIDMPDWEVLKDYSLRIRARSVAGVYGEFSEDIEHTTVEPAVDLDGPILSDLYTDGLGNLFAVWDGTLGGVPAPNRVGYVAAEVSSDGGTVYQQMGTPITAMGTIVVAPSTYGTFHVRLRVFDGLGQPGDVSAPLTVTTENPHINETVSLSSTTQALVSPAGGGATTPATAVITGTATNTTITSWQYSADGAAFSNTVPTGVSRSGNVVTVTGATMTANTIAVRMADAHGAFDVITIAKLSDGAPGSPGSPGAPGAPGNGVASTEVRYQVGASGTTAPTGTWQVNVPSTSPGQFLWTRTVTTYTDSSTSTGYSVAAHGTNGSPGAPGAPGNGISATEVRYQVGSSGTTAPSGTWLTTVPVTAEGQFLWSRTITTYTDSSTSTVYSVAAHGAPGAPGTPGISATASQLGNDAVAIPTTSAGVTTAQHDVTVPFTARLGTARIAGTVAATGLPSGVTVQSNTAATPSADGALVLRFASGSNLGGTLNGEITLTVTANSQSFVHKFSWSKALGGIPGADGADGSDGSDGVDGTSPISVDTTSSAVSIVTDDTGKTGASAQTATIGFTAWSGTTRIAATVAVSGLPSGVTVSSNTPGTTSASGTLVLSFAANSTLGGNDTGVITLTISAGGLSFARRFTWSKSRRGANGGDAYTVLLSNESHTFPGTASAAVPGSTTSRVYAYKGATAANATVGTITGAPAGMTTSVASNGTTAPIITITVTADLVTQSGTLSVPITVNSITFVREISWAVAWSLVGARIPKLPEDLAAVPGAGWSALGYFPESWFDLTWTAPTEDVDDAPIGIAGYDVWGKRTDEPEMRFLTSVAAPETRITVGQGEEWAFSVEAISDAGGRSGLTEVVSGEANAAVSPAPPPAPPTLDQYAGLLRIKWAGAGMLPQIRTVYATISTSAGGTYTRAGMPLTGAGEIIVPGLAPAQYWAKIVMEDELGQLSTSAAAGPITLLPITGVTVQTSAVANTGIKMTNAALTAYDVSGNPSFILDATTGAVWIAPYDAVFEFGATGTVAETGVPTTGVQISSENSSFNTFVHSAGIQIRNDHTPISWWEADQTDASLVNFVAPRARVDDRFMVGEFEFLREAKSGNKSRLVVRYRGA